MALSSGPAESRHLTVRPLFSRSISLALANTSRCFMTPGSDRGNGSAMRVTGSPSSRARRASIARRVGSASAAKARSSCVSL